MSNHDLNRVHRRYVVVSSTFKSAWTFHQFVQGLRKVFPALPATDYPADFQSIYGELKQVSENLSETSVETAGLQLEQVENRLRPVIEAPHAAFDIGPRLGHSRRHDRFRHHCPPSRSCHAQRF